MFVSTLAFCIHIQTYTVFKMFHLPFLFLCSYSLKNKSRVSGYINVSCFCPHPVEVVDYISRVAASKVRHGHSDLLIVIRQVDANVFFQLLTPTQRGVYRVLIKHPAVEKVLLWDLCAHTHTHTLRLTQKLGHSETSLCSSSFSHSSNLNR